MVLKWEVLLADRKIGPKDQYERSREHEARLTKFAWQGYEAKEVLEL